MLDSKERDTCPKCGTKLEEEWEEEFDFTGNPTGFEFEILKCQDCVHKEYI